MKPNPKLVRAGSRRRAFAALGTGALVVAGLGVLPSQAATPAAATAPTLWLLDAGTGKCLSPAGGGSGVNNTVVQFTCDRDTSRQYSLVKSGSFYKIRNKSNGLCLSPAGGNVGANVPIVQYLCDGDPSRAWDVMAVANTPDYEIRNAHSNLCLAIAGGSTANNATAVQFTCDGNPTRQFIFAAQLV